ncbi:MAG: L,D-transpeptidase [Gaiellaceae bacterium]
MRGVLLLLVLAALVAAAPAYGQEPVIADGVTIAGVAVGGMNEAEAVSAVRTSFNRPMAVRLRARHISVAPFKLGARPRVYDAVQRALAASADAAVPLAVAMRRWQLDLWVKRWANRFHRPPRNSRVVLLGSLRPWITRAYAGRKLLRDRSEYRLLNNLRAHSRGPVQLATQSLRPSVTPAKFGPVVVIRRGSRALYLYRGTTSAGMSLVRSFRVAVGQPSYPTPLGRWRIVTKQRNPWWNPPDADWAEGAEPIPPGPGNPLGTRWMGLSAGGVGIHGTYNAASIGGFASHGCIRMYLHEAEWLFERVRIGTTVFIVGA